MVGSLSVGNLGERIQGMTPPIWQRMSPTQRIVIGAGALTAVALTLGLLIWAQQPEYGQLYTGLSAEDAGAITGKLKETRVPYQLGDGGKTILVPSGEIHESRLQMAAQGLPTGGRVGFEVFDRNIFGMPEFVQHLNYQRALEGELGRTIGQVAGVESARVHLVIPKDALFTEAQREATASVVVKLRPNAKLNAQQVQSIRHLVSTSVEGLQTKNITLADTEGRLLQDATQPDASTAQLDAKRAYERNVEQQVASMLEQTIGPSKASVRVNALLNWDKIEATTETFTPPGTAVQPRSVRELNESFRGEGPPPEGGVPGSTTNVPPTYFGSGGSGPSDYTKRDVTTNYELSKQIEKRLPAPGTIQRLSVAVMVPEEFGPRVAGIQALVAAAAGVNPERGDIVAVQPLPLDTSRADAERQAVSDEQQFQLIRTGMLMLGGLLALALIIFGLGRTIGAQRRPSPTVVWEAEPPQPAQLSTTETAPPPAAAGAVAPMALPVPEEELQRLAAEDRQRQEAEVRTEEARIEEEERAERTKSLQEMAQNDPERLAEVLQIWMSEDRRGR